MIALRLAFSNMNKIAAGKDISAGAPIPHPRKDGKACFAIMARFNQEDYLLMSRILTRISYSCEVEATGVFRSAAYSPNLLRKIEFGQL